MRKISCNSFVCEMKTTTKKSKIKQVDFGSQSRQIRIKFGIAWYLLYKKWIWGEGKHSFFLKRRKQIKRPNDNCIKYLKTFDVLILSKYAHNQSVRKRVR